MKKSLITSIFLISSLLMTGCNSGPQPAKTTDRESDFARIEANNNEASKNEASKNEASKNEASKNEANNTVLDGESQTLPEFKSIEVDVLAADISVVTGEDWSISYNLSEKEPLKRFGVEGDKLYVETEFDPSKHFDHTGNWYVTVTVPENVTLSELDLDTASGDVYIQKISCDSASLSSTSGDVEAEEITAQDIEMDSVSGDICATNVSAVAMDMETVSGDLSVNGMLGELKTSTVSGDTEVSGSISDESKLESTSGDIELSVNHPASVYANSIGTIMFNGDKVYSPLNHDDGILISIKSVSGKINVQTA